MGATRDLAEFVAGIAYQTLSGEVRERVKSLALDTVGIMLRARHDAESTPPMLAAARLLGLTGGTCSVIGEAEVVDDVARTERVALARQAEQAAQREEEARNAMQAAHEDTAEMLADRRTTGVCDAAWKVSMRLTLHRSQLDKSCFRASPAREGASLQFA